MRTGCLSRTGSGRDRILKFISSLEIQQENDNDKLKNQNESDTTRTKTIKNPCLLVPHNHPPLHQALCKCPDSLRNHKGASSSQLEASSLSLSRFTCGPDGIQIFQHHKGRIKILEVISDAQICPNHPKTKNKTSTLPRSSKVAVTGHPNHSGKDHSTQWVHDLSGFTCFSMTGIPRYRAMVDGPGLLVRRGNAKPCKSQIKVPKPKPKPEELARRFPMRSWGPGPEPLRVRNCM